MKVIVLISLLVLSGTCVFSQKKESALALHLLENEKIADININQEKFIKAITKITDYCQVSFQDFPTTQKIGVLLIVHKKGKPTYKIFSEPSLKTDFNNKTVKELNKIEIENTKLVDFPIFISINASSEEIELDFKNFKTPNELKLTEYKNADLKTKLKLNKEYAINEVLPVLNAYQVIVDDKFEGVKKFGNLIQKTDFTKNQNIQKITSLNSDYWRALLEMESGNQLIPITNIFTLISQGEFDYAKKSIEIIRLFSDSKTVSDKYLEDINYRLNLFSKDLESKIRKGIIEHDKGNYKNAITIYKNILKIYPNSSWTLYEKYYSENAKRLEKTKITLKDNKDWDRAKVEIYKHNPLYSMNVRASNGKEAYLLFRRQSIGSLFKKKDEKLKDIYKYAEIATDLGIYDYAAQLFWLTANYDKENSQKSIHNYLYCLEKLGHTKLKSNFKGDFKKIFKQIEEDKQSEMKNSSIYKAMKE